METSHNPEFDTLLDTLDFDAIDESYKILTESQKIIEMTITEQNKKIRLERGKVYRVTENVKNIDNIDIRPKKCPV